jgi:hypothetical protein
MRVVPQNGLTPIPGTESFLAYIQRFDIVPQLNPKFSVSHQGPYPDPATTMFVLKRATRADGSRMGDIIPLRQIRSAVELTPCFGSKADIRLTKETSFECSETFWLNKYFDKETYYALNSLV